MTLRNFVFTLNNPEGDINVNLETYKHLRYAVYQLEIGENGTQHYQGYVELSKPARLSGISRVLPGAHIEHRRGTREQARSYAMKEDTRIEGPYEIGVWKAGGQGSRNDLNEVKTLIDKGSNELEITQEHFASWCKHYRAFREYKRIKTPSRTTKTKVVLVIGKPGTGKSHWCQQQAPNAFWKPRGIWWDGYEGHKEVIIDEYYGWLPWDTLLRLLDKYPLICETKGGHVNFIAETIYITSNKDITQWYQNTYDIGALLRRIDEWVYINPDYSVSVFTAPAEFYEYREQQQQ